MGALPGVRRRSVEPHSRTTERTRPRNLVVPEDLYEDERPEDYKSLLHYLESKGRVKVTEYGQMMKARNLYVTKGMGVRETATKCRVDEAILERWIMLFGWEEERDKRIFNSFRKLAGFRERMSPHVDQRHDRLAGTIESVAERMLQAHQDGTSSLSTKDLSTLASVLKSTMDIRRVVRNKSNPADRKEVDVRLSMPENIENVAHMIQSLAQEPRQIEAPKRRNQLEVSFGQSIGTDDEFEDAVEVEAGGD